MNVILWILGAGRSVEVKDICARFTTDLIGVTAYGIKFGALTDPEALMRKVGKDIFSKNYKRHIEILSTLLIPSVVNVFNFQIFGKKATDFLRSMFWQAIDGRINSGIKRSDLIDFIIDLKKDQENNPDNKLGKCLCCVEFIVGRKEIAPEYF